MEREAPAQLGSCGDELPPHLLLASSAVSVRPR